MNERLVYFFLGAAFGVFIGLVALFMSADWHNADIQRFKESGVIAYHPQTGQLVPVPCDREIIDVK